LINLIEQKLKNPKGGMVAANKRLSQILRDNTVEIAQRALKEMKSDPLIGALPVNDEQRIEYIPGILEELATMLESAEPEQTAKTFIQGAEVRAKRYLQRYTIPLLATHGRLVGRAIYDVIHENLLSLNLSYFMFDLKRLNDSLGIQLEYTQIAYLNAEQRNRGQSGQQP
jgi:hypothetical protein